MYGESIDGSYKNYISVAPIGLERVPTKHKVVGSNPTRDTKLICISVDYCSENMLRR